MGKQKRADRGGHAQQLSMDHLLPIIRRVRRPLIVADAPPAHGVVKVEPTRLAAESDGKENRDAENEGTDKGAEGESKY
jgi:hypothetical protein